MWSRLGSNSDLPVPVLGLKAYVTLPNYDTFSCQKGGSGDDDKPLKSQYPKNDRQSNMMLFPSIFEH